MANRKLIGTQDSQYSLNFANNTAKLVTVTENAAFRPETSKKVTWTAKVYLFNTNENVLPRIISKGAFYWCFMGDNTNFRAASLAIEVPNPAGGVNEYWGTRKLQPNQWYHLAFTFNDGTCQHYINGEADTTNVINNPNAYTGISSTSASDLIIGNSTSNRNFPGYIKNIHIYTGKTLTAKEIYDDYSGIPVSGLTASYGFGEGSGNTLTDSVSGFNGTITSATWETI